MKSENPLGNISNQPVTPHTDSIEDKPKETGKEALRRMQRDIPKINLSKELKKIEEGQLETENPESEELKRLKAEINGLAAFSIQEIWNGIKGSTDEDSFQGFHQLIKENPLSVINVQEIEMYKLKEDLEPGRGFYIWRDILERVLNKHINDWHAFHELRSNLLPKEVLDANKSDRAFQRYQTVLKSRSRIEPSEHSLEGAPSQISAGLYTSLEVMLGMFSITPIIYYRQFKKPISKEEFYEITKSSTPLFLNMGNMELAFFQEFVIKAELLRSSILGNSLLLPEPFHLVEKNGQLMLDFTAGATRGMEVSNPQDRLLTGCPAITAKGSDGKSMMLELYSWFIKLQEETNFPDLEQYNNLIIRRSGERS